MITHDADGLKEGAELGALADLIHHAPQVLEGLGGLGRTLTRESQFGIPKNPSFRSVNNAIRRVYGLANDALRRRPNTLFYKVRNKTGIRNVEWMDTSHFKAHAEIKGPWQEWIWHRPAFLVPMWETEHALVDARKFQMTPDRFKAVYEGQRMFGAQAKFHMLHLDARSFLLTLPQYNRGRKLWNAYQNDH